MKLCAECGERAVAPRAVAGRTSPWKHFPSLPVSADLEIPTCQTCGAEWIDRKTAEKIDADMARAAGERLSRAARHAIEVLGDSFNQRDLERDLGLSAGYLSKVKHGKETPSASLVALLTLLAVRPARLEQVTHVWETGNLPPCLANVCVSQFSLAVDETETAAVAS
jgi:Zn-finger nucleic acid-binding protein